MTDHAFRCRLCDSTDLTTVLPVKEVTVGGAEVFSFGECARCQSLTLLDPPADLAPYYPADYYAFRPLPPLPWRARMAALVDQIAERLGGPPVAGMRKLLSRSVGRPVRRDEAILDVGCGSGHFLARLHASGFRNVAGLDPYCPDASALPFPVHVEELADHHGCYRQIYFQDVLEHFVDPLAALREAKRLLAPDGEVVVGVPRVPCQVFTVYGDCWYGLDPPRHLFIPSAEGLLALADRAGLDCVVAVQEDWLEFAFSELVRRGAWHQAVDPAEHLSPAELAELRARAEASFAAGASDRLSAVFRPRDDG